MSVEIQKQREMDDIFHNLCQVEKLAKVFHQTRDSIIDLSRERDMAKQSLDEKQKELDSLDQQILEKEKELQDNLLPIGELLA